MNYKYNFGGIFSQVGISFKIESSIIKKIWYTMEDNIPLSEFFKGKYPNYTLSFLYSTKKDCSFQVSLPSISKRYKQIEFVIYMPYKELNIKDEDLKNKIFLKYLKSGIIEIFENYKFDTNKLKEIFESVSG
jgi:hypothetical protein